MEEIVISSAMILNTKTEILLVRKKGSKYFQLPGGKVKSNEAKFETLKRELFEEINIEVKEENCIFLGIHETNAVNEKNNEEILERVNAFAYDKLYAIAAEASAKHERSEKFALVKEELIASFTEEENRRKWETRIPRVDTRP